MAGDEHDMAVHDQQLCVTNLHGDELAGLPNTIQ